MEGKHCAGRVDVVRAEARARETQRVAIGILADAYHVLVETMRRKRVRSYETLVSVAQGGRFRSSLG